jgi:serine phosphatase RsbU (regulator of sigma subunit)
VVAVVAIGAIGTGIAFVNERARVAQRDRQSAVAAAAAISDRLARATSLLAGVDGLAADGAVSTAEFSAFATDVVRDGALQSLAWVLPVGDNQRAAFEASTGRPITQRDGQGRFETAARRPSYAVVVDVVPKTDLTRATLGFDIASDPVRANAAAVAASGRRAVLSRPVKLAPSGRPGFFLIQPIFTGEGDGSAPVGYVSTGLLAERLLAGAGQRLPPGTGVGLRDGGESLASVDRPGASTTIDVNGRTWMVSVAGSPANTVLPLALGSSTLLFAGFAGALAYRESRLNRATSRLTRQVEGDAARTERLATVARALSGAEHLGDVVHIIEHEVPAVLGADFADIGLVDGEHLAMLGRANRAGLDPDLFGRYRTLPLDADLPIAEAVRTSNLRLVPDLGDYRPNHPDLLDNILEVGLRSAAAAPLLDVEGTSRGVLVLAWRRPTPFDAPTVSVIRTLSELCGQTLQRAMTADRRHELIVALQERMLPTPPTVAGLRIIARYRPAAEAVGMGGDWYQFLPLADGSLVVVLGDVTGHGVEAIATMTQIQSVIAAAVHTGVPLSEIFAYVQHGLAVADAAYATALLLHVNLAAGRVGYTSAGHPYPLVRRPDGTTLVLTGSQHPLLGMGQERAQLAYVDFPVGATLVAYTDGLIERRNRPINVGIEALREAVAHLDADLDQSLDKMIADSLRDATAADAVDDDIAVVVLHRPAAG